MKTLPTFLLLTATLALASATVARADTVSNWLALTITNPTPAANDNFGLSVAAVGADRLLIGAYFDDTDAPNAGVAYLYSTNGTLLTTFTNPTPTAFDLFGRSVAAVGTDRVLIGALVDDTGVTNAGAAYLFSTNGVLLTTFTNPTPAAWDEFGRSVAVLGSDRVLIGANGDDTGADDAGAAYLFSTNGALLATFANPTPAIEDYFGYAVVALGSDRVLVGAPYDGTGASAAGAAYLFTTNGALLVTFTNPTPAVHDEFGSSVAAVGSDRILIGAYRDHVGDDESGVAYLFSTNGALLTTFTNPTPTTSDAFGLSVAAVGTDWVLIGARGADTNPIYPGSVYLFNTNGALLTIFTNPTPARWDNFGSSVAAVGSDRVLIGANGDSTGGSAAGAAYLFSLEPFTPLAPLLSTSLNPQLSTITVSWPAPAEGWVLERTNALPSVAATSWPQVPPPFQTNAGTISVTFTNLPATRNQFLRLHKP